MPIALCSRVISDFCARKATVTSPANPFGVSEGRGIRYILGAVFFDFSHFGRVASLLVSKYFHRLITLAAVASARMIVFPPVCGSCVSVALWQ